MPTVEELQAQVDALKAAQTETPTMAQLRTDRDKILAESKAKDEELQKAKDLLTAADRAKLEEVDRVRAELGDARTKASELEGYKIAAENLESKFKGLYENKIATLPSEAQEKALKLTGTQGSFADKYEMLSELEPLLAPAVVVKQGGNPGNPGVPGVPGVTPPAAPAPIAPNQWGNIDVADAMRTAMVQGGKQPTGVSEKA